MKTLTPLLIVLVLLGKNAAFSQASDSASNALKQKDCLAVFHRSLQYDDLTSAAYALNTYLLYGGAANFKDSLAIVYYRLGNLNGSYKLANETYQADNKSITALTLLADITGKAGDTKASLDWYEKLCVLSPEPYNFYQLATRQFVLERIGECRTSLQKVITDSVKARNDKVSLEIQPGNNETVPVLAAAYNMMGALSFREKKTEEAKKYYELAVKEYPEFTIAKQNLVGLNPKPAAKTPTKR